MLNFLTNFQNGLKVIFIRIYTITILLMLFKRSMYTVVEFPLL